MPKRRPKRLTRIARARAVYFAGLILLAAGVGLALGCAVSAGVGFGVALGVAGVGLIAWSVLLYDVDEPPPLPREDGPW